MSFHGAHVSAEARAQHAQYHFASTRAPDGALRLFAPVTRALLQADVRAYAKRAPDGLRLQEVYGAEHADRVRELRDFYAAKLHVDADMDFWRGEMDACALSLVVRDAEENIVGALTAKHATLVNGDRLFYVTLLRVNDASTGALAPDAEKVSHYLYSQLHSIACASVPVGGVAHLLTQSVGYKLSRHKGAIRCDAKGDADAAARAFWAKHLEASKAAILLGVQLALLPHATWPDCRFMHTTVRHLPVLAQSSVAWTSL